MTSARRGGQWFPNGAAFSFSTVHRRSSTRLVLDTPTLSPLPFFTIFVWGRGDGRRQGAGNAGRRKVGGGGGNTGIGSRRQDGAMGR